MTTNFKQVAIDSLVPYAKNSRNHPPGQIDQIAASIKEFGFLSPCVISADNTIIAGHGRVMAAKKLGIETVPCVVADHLTDAQRRAYVLIDNRLTDTSEWDKEMLKIELADLTVNFPELDLPVMGFSPEEIEALGLNTIDAEVVGLTDEDAVPEAPKTPTTKTGDIWLLGNHRVMCGDSTDAGSVALLMNGEKADLCFTSPPYGQQRDYTAEGKEKVSDWDGLMNGVFANLPMKDDGQVLVNLGMIHRENEWVPYWDKWIEFMRSIGWRRFGLYVWDQGFGLPGDWNGRFAPSHEMIFHFNKQSIRPNKSVEKKPENIKERKTGASTMRGKDGICREFSSPEASAQPNKIPDSVVRINRMHGGHKIDHPAIFPVELVEFALESFDGNLFEPFCGSGTAVIACEKTSRRCFGMELSPQYCDVIVKRWEQFTGRLATLEGDGRTFEEIQRERVG